MIQIPRCRYLDLKGKLERLELPVWLERQVLLAGMGLTEKTDRTVSLGSLD
jgi:hypothetical protein